MAVKKRTLGNKGQAAIELALALPFLIWLIFYTLNGFYSLHTAHVAQKYAAMALYRSINHRANIIIDDQDQGGRGSVHGKDFMAVQYTNPDGQLPQRKIISGPSEVNNIIGICREPGC